MGELEIGKENNCALMDMVIRVRVVDCRVGRESRPKITVTVVGSVTGRMLIPSRYPEKTKIVNFSSCIKNTVFTQLKTCYSFYQEYCSPTSAYKLTLHYHSGLS